MLHIYNVVYSASLIHNTMPNYVSCVLFEIVGIIWCLSLCLLMPAVSLTVLALLKSVTTHYVSDSGHVIWP